MSIDTLTAADNHMAAAGCGGGDDDEDGGGGVGGRLQSAATERAAMSDAAMVAAATGRGRARVLQRMSREGAPTSLIWSVRGQASRSDRKEAGRTRKEAGRNSIQNLLQSGGGQHWFT